MDTKTSLVNVAPFFPFNPWETRHNLLHHVTRKPMFYSTATVLLPSTRTLPMASSVMILLHHVSTLVPYLVPVIFMFPC